MDHKDMTEHRHRLIRAGDWLRDQRERRHISVRELAGRVGVSTQQVYDWQAGKNQPSDERAQQLADALGLDIITARAGLALWVPADAQGQAQPEPARPDLTQVPLRELYAELTRRIETEDEHVTESDEKASGM